MTTKHRRRSIFFNPRPVRAFLIMRTVRGLVCPPPPGARPLMVVELRGKKTVEASRRDHAFAHIVFSPRSTFDLVRSGQRSNYREKWHFLTLHAHRGVSMCRSDLKLSPACSLLFNSEQDRVLLLYPIAIFSIRSAPKNAPPTFDLHVKPFYTLLREVTTQS